MPPTVFAPSSATEVGEFGIVPNFATASGAFGVPAVQFALVVHNPFAAPRFHSEMVAEPLINAMSICTDPD